MKTATVGDIQKNFSKVLRIINAGEEIIITKRGKPIAKISSLGPNNEITWPDFFNETIEVRKKPLSDLVIENREDRF
ncbi:MAG: type II toxin-antitoxin system Phd/YefM family antitoxin [bacterium]